MTRQAALMAGLALALGFAACGKSTDPVDTAAGSAAAAKPAAIREITITRRPVAVRHARDMKPAEDGLLGSEPKPIIPKGPPPDFLAYQTLIKGDGRTAHFGDRVSIQYIGAEYENGRQYTSSWDWKAPYRFEVGTAGLLKGFNLGVAGMKVGERRELVIPPAFADPNGTVGGIPDEETLIYVVDLLGVE